MRSIWTSQATRGQRDHQIELILLLALVFGTEVGAANVVKLGGNYLLLAATQAIAECLAMAEESGVAGWVRNLPDGRVEAVFEGPDEEVRRLVDWVHNGPRWAVVDGVAVQSEPPEGLAAFRVK